ncbi:MAG: hypothetical protein Q8929_04495 [Bacillota bacterium]|nr:hypothetical protein [Bacillota bacterium]
MSINKDLTQSVLDYIAHQPVNSGPDGTSGGQIGYERARQILESNGAERDAYLKHFQEENPRYKIQSINSAKESAVLDSKFESGAAALKDQEFSSVNQHDAHNRGSILEKGLQENLHPNKIPTSRRGEIASSIEGMGQKIDQGKATIDHHETALQQATKDSKDKSLAGSVLSNSLASLTPDTTATLQRLAEKDPTYKQYLAEQQKQRDGKTLADSSSHTSSQKGSFEKQTPSSAFTTVKARLTHEENERSQETQLSQTPSTQDSSGQTLTNTEWGKSSFLVDKTHPTTEKMPIIKETSLPLLSASTSSPSTSQAAIKTEKIPEPKSHLFQENKNNAQQSEVKTKDSSPDSSPPTPLSSKIRT